MFASTRSARRFVRTELTQRAIARIVETTGRTEAESEDALANQLLLGRLLEPEEVAYAVVPPFSAAASINGQALVTGPAIRSQPGS